MLPPPPPPTRIERRIHEQKKRGRPMKPPLLRFNAASARIGRYADPVIARAAEIAVRRRIIGTIPVEAPVHMRPAKSARAIIRRRRCGAIVAGRRWRPAMTPARRRGRPAVPVAPRRRTPTWWRWGRSAIPVTPGRRTPARWWWRSPLGECHITRGGGLRRCGGHAEGRCGLGGKASQHQAGGQNPPFQPHGNSFLFNGIECSLRDAGHSHPDRPVGARRIERSLFLAG